MAVISIVNQKGGVAKTTTALHIAEALTYKGLSVIVFDVDPQGSATRFYNRESREWPYKVVPRQKNSLEDEIQALAVDFDVVVVDTRPDLGKDTQTVIRESDLVIVPVKPGGYELDSISQLIDVVEKIAENHQKLIIRSLRCFVSTRTILTRKVEKILDSSTLKPFKFAIQASELFNQIPVTGELIFDIKSNPLAKYIGYRYTRIADEIIEELIKIRTGD